MTSPSSLGTAFDCCGAGIGQWTAIRLALYPRFLDDIDGRDAVPRVHARAVNPSNGSRGGGQPGDHIGGLRSLCRMTTGFCNGNDFQYPRSEGCFGFCCACYC